MTASSPPSTAPPTSSSERRRRNRDEMKGAILTAARQIMREEGVAALNMHEVARRVGLRTQSLYYYFPSKSALYDALFLLGTRMFYERQEQLLRQHTDVWETLRGAMGAYLGFAQQHPELWQLVFERTVPGFVPSEESMEESRRLLGVGMQVITQAIESGDISPGLSPAQATDFTSAVMHGLTAAHMANEPHLPPGEGRFGALIPAAVEVLRVAWAPGRRTSTAGSTGPGNHTAQD